MFSTVSKRQVWLVSGAGIALLTVVLSWVIPGGPIIGRVGQTLNNEATNTAAAMNVQEAPRPGLPIRLEIPSIKVNAGIEEVGRTPQGAMDVPSHPSTTAWYNLGPRPGEVGSAVIAGHYGWYNNIPAIFDNLHKIKIGDNLSVVDDAGQTLHFVVRELRSYTLSENPSDVFNSDDGQTHLNLVTCQGAWNAAQKSYPKRLVVFTDLVSQ